MWPVLRFRYLADLGDPVGGKMAKDRYDTITYVNGDWVPWSEVRIEPDDIGFQLGDVA